MEANGLTHPTSHSSRFLNSKCYHAWQITPWFCATTTSNNPCFLTDAEFSELILVETPPVEAESESGAYRQPSCSPSDPAGTCWTAARRACSPRRWEPTSCPGSDRRQMSTPPGTSRRWAGWCPADATLASWSYRGSSGRCETGTPSAPCWGRETRSLLLENQRRLNHHLRNQKMIMRDSPMLGWCTNEQITSVKGKNLIVMADYLLSTSRFTTRKTRSTSGCILAVQHNSRRQSRQSVNMTRWSFESHKHCVAGIRPRSNAWPAIAILRLCPSRALMKCPPRSPLMSPPSKIDRCNMLTRTSKGLPSARPR